MDQDGIDLFFTVGKDITREEDLLPLFSHAPDPLLSDALWEKSALNASILQNTWHRGKLPAPVLPLIRINMTVSSR